jgi:iron complex transport system permease protein
MGNNVSDAVRLYRSITARKLGSIAGVGVLLFVLLIVNILSGSSGMSIKEVLRTIFYPAGGERTSVVIIWHLRLPVCLMALTVGAALSVAGAEMQTILGNPLASPYTLGIAAAAGFGAALMLAGFVGAGILGHLLVPTGAFLFSFLACLILYGISRIKGARAETMVLSGIAVMFLFNALLSLLQFLASEEQLQAIVFWLFGSLYKANWTSLGITAAVLCAVLPLLMADAWKLTALRLGEEKARSMGIKVEALRIKVFVLVSLITGIAVCFVGTIGFIGLVGPHIARMIVGEDQRFFLPLSALTGALLLSAASVAGKFILPGAIFPIGIITSLIGVPFFISLILSRKRGKV